MAHLLRDPPPQGAFAAYVLTPSRADALAIGVLCALWVRSERRWNWLVAHRRWLYAAFVALALGLLLLLSKGYGFYDRTFHGVDFSVLACFYATALLIAVTGQDAFVRWVLCNPLLTRLGGIAYGTYLFHYLCLDLFRFLAGHYFHRSSALIFLASQFLGIATALGLATVSWRYFEKPMVRRGQSYQY